LGSDADADNDSDVDADNDSDSDLDVDTDTDTDFDADFMTARLHDRIPYPSPFYEIICTSLCGNGMDILASSRASLHCSMHSKYTSQ